MKDAIEQTYIETQAYFNRYDFASPDNYFDELNILRNNIIKRIEANPTGKKSTRLKKIVFQLEQELFKIYETFEQDLKDEMTFSAEYSYNASNKAFKEAFNLESKTFDTLPVQVLNIFNSLTQPIPLLYGDEERFFRPKKEINKLFKDHSFQYVKAINSAIATGKSINDSVKEFKDSSEKIDGVKNHQIKSLTRTTIADSMSRSRQYTEDKNFSDVIEGFQWITVFDTRTSLLCSARAGRIEKERKDFNGLPPLHFGCRSLIAPLTKISNRKDMTVNNRFWDETKTVDKDGEKYTKFKLASDTKKKVKIPGKKSKFSAFDEAFKTWPEKRQIQFLGPQRYKLYKTGKIGMKTLVDGSGRIRTIKELSELAGIDLKNDKEIRRRDIKAYKPKETARYKKVIEQQKN